MSHCPNDSALAVFLDEGLSGAELSAIEVHLEGCDRCQQVLEVLTTGRFSAPEWGETATTALAALSTESVPADGPSLLVDSDLLLEQHSYQKRQILGITPRGPSSYRAAPDERIAGEGGATAYPPEVDGYDILGRLGRGGMGVVYRARQHGLDRLVALKMLRGGGHADAESLARFRIEVRAVARLDHPNVVRVYDVGESRGLAFVSLELLEGGTLEARIGGVPQPNVESATLAATLARAVAAMHRVGIVHRDLKSANILFGRDGIARITDFGLAKRLDEDDGQTHSGQVMGSPSFMAPEQARGVGAAIGPAADVYSLGAILYEMLAGRPPFKGGSALETMHQVVHAEPVPPSKLRPGLARDLETICLKCLSKAPEQRYATADRLADDLGRFLAGSPIEARRIHPLERGWKWARREPGRASLVIGVGLGIIAVIAGGWHLAEAARDRVERITTLRLVAQPILRRATADAAAGRWDEVREQLDQLPSDIKSIPEVGDLDHRAQALLQRVKQVEEAGRAAIMAQDRRARFVQLARQVRLADAHQYAIQGPEGIDPRPTRAAAEAALGAVAHFEGDGIGWRGAWRRSAEPEPTGATERAEIDLAWRELVLLWIEAIGRPASGEDPSTRASLALGLLDRLDAAASGRRVALSLRSRMAAQAGDPSLSLELRRRAEATPAADSLDRIATGREWQNQGEWTRAIVEYKAAERLDPDQTRARLGLAICELLGGQPEAAQPRLVACLRDDPGSSDLLILLGIAEGKSASLLRDRARRAPADHGPLAEAEALFRAADHDFQQAARSDLTTPQRVSLLMSRGLVRFWAARYQDAAADFAEVLTLDPDHLAAQVNLGQARLRLGQGEAAVAALDRAIRLAPTNPKLYRERAVARLARRRPTDPNDARRAVLDLDEAIRLAPAGSPELASFYAQRARLHHRSRDFEAARADSDRAVRLDPTNLEAALVQIQTLLELRESAAVIDACGSALARHGERVDLWELRGIARSDLRRFSAAIGDFTHALTLDPDRATARLQRGWAYLVSDAPTLALDDFQVVLDQYPGHPEALGGRGILLAQAGRHRAAVSDAEELVRKAGPGDARVLYNAARIYARAASGLPSRPGSRSPTAGESLAADYEEHTFNLIRAAIAATPPGQRAAFCRETVQLDPAFATIRPRPEFTRLAGQAGRPAP